MKPSQLRVGDDFLYRSTCREYYVRFIERIPGLGRIRPTVNVFSSKEMGMITMTDREVQTCVNPATAGNRPNGQKEE